MSEKSILAEAIKGGNNPFQNTSTLKGFYEAPNPLLRIMNQETVTDISVLSEGKVGSFLRRKSIVSGDIATIIDASLDYFLNNKDGKLPKLDNIKYANTRRNFVPIIFKTDFRFKLPNDDSAVKKPIYIIFDSTPDKISFTKTANWQSKEFLGRPEPVWTYQNSGAVAFTLTGKFYAESFTAHEKILKVSDYIMSLVTPSELNYMPSPITVFIGEWKKLRCIVTSVTIDNQGPWVVKVDNEDINNSVRGSVEEQTRTDAMDRQSFGSLPTHAPYMFEATFGLTIVGQDNHVNYAEQVIQKGLNNTDTELVENVTKIDLTTGSSITTTIEQDALDAALTQTGSTTDSTSGLYNIQNTTQYTFNNGQISRSVSQGLEYTPAAESINIYDEQNNIRRLSDQGVISNAVSSQMLLLYQKNKAIPAPTLLPLNPFKKLF